ncbi:MAG: hypothetical protein QGD92_04740 [Gammaproteobacteria bacterium]|nr:hypothetical protein [Gammaproteobacteria bacterium]
MQNNHQKTWVYAVGLLLLSLGLNGCMTVQPASQIIGSWDGQLHGFPIVVEYTETTVGVSGTEPVAYSIEDNVITLATENVQTYRIEFPSKHEMIQIDDVTGTEQRYIRRNPESD